MDGKFFWPKKKKLFLLFFFVFTHFNGALLSRPSDCPLAKRHRLAVRENRGKKNNMNTEDLLKYRRYILNYVFRP